MIVGDRDKRTREFAAGTRVTAFAGFERSAQLKLDPLEAATPVRDLAALPGNRFEALSGDRRGQYSIRINAQWPICFEWPDGAAGPVNVGIVDYHEPALFTNGDGGTGRVAPGAVPAGPRAVGPPRPVRRARRGVRASG
jgi:proteic killer suppression protein